MELVGRPGREDAAGNLSDGDPELAVGGGRADRVAPPDVDAVELAAQVDVLALFEVEPFAVPGGVEGDDHAVVRVVDDGRDP